MSRRSRPDVARSSPEKPTVLVVDDEQSCQDLFGFYLRSFEVVSAYDAQQAMEAVGTRRPDAIVLDLNLPDQTGFDLLPALRQACPGVPVLIMSAHHSTANVVRTVRAGAVDFIPKSIESYRLLPVTIEMALAAAREARAAARELLAWLDCLTELHAELAPFIAEAIAQLDSEAEVDVYEVLRARTREALANNPLPNPGVAIGLLHRSRREWERFVAELFVAATSGNKRAAGRRLGVSATSVSSRMRAVTPCAVRDPKKA